MLKIHYHSDCPFFAGCESMLINFFNSKGYNNQFKMSFSYRYSDKYSKALYKNIKYDIDTFPFRFPYLSRLFYFFEKKNIFLKKTLTLFGFSILNYPLFIYEVIVLFYFFRKREIDILHVNNGGYPAALSARAAVVAGKLVGIPNILMVVNNMAADYKHPLRWLDYPVDLAVKYSTDLFITGSEAARERLIAVLNFPDCKAKSIHNGISIRPITETTSETRRKLHLDIFKGIVFGVVALLIPRKGHQVLFDAILKMVTKNQSLSFKIMVEGDGFLREELKNFVHENQLEEWIVFIGEEDNVMNFMSMLDVLILPSIQNEDFPNVILEAMGLGKAVIASRLAGTPEQIIDGVTGLLIEPNNVEQLAEAISCLLDRPELILSMGKRGKERFEQFFSSSIALNNYMSTYYQLSNKMNKSIK